MTTELEKQFFDTFEIEERELEYPDNFTYYPEITDTHYLQLICELSGVCCPHFAFERGISELKETVLRFCIYYKDLLKHQVQRLFEEK